RQIANSPASFQRLGKDVEAVDDHGSLARRHKAGDDAHRGGLACAVGTKKAEDRTLFSLEGDITHRDEVAVAFGQILYLDHADRLAGSRSTAPISNAF